MLSLFSSIVWFSNNHSTILRHLLNWNNSKCFPRTGKLIGYSSPSAAAAFALKKHWWSWKKSCWSCANENLNIFTQKAFSQSSLVLNFEHFETTISSWYRFTGSIPSKLSTMNFMSACPSFLKKPSFVKKHFTKHCKKYHQSLRFLMKKLIWSYFGISTVDTQITKQQFFGLRKVKSNFFTALGSNFF